MGWIVLYVAFGVVALWLLGEVLLQYKARLRWRLLAFKGFLCVVAGALIPSVAVIGIGIAAFATGQTFVTLSYRRGFVAGWALTGVPGVKRRRAEQDEEPERDPAPKSNTVEAPEPVPALAGPGGYGSDAFQPNGLGQGGFDTPAFGTVGMGAPGGFNVQNGYDTGGFATVDPMGVPGGLGVPNGNRYDDVGGNGNAYDGYNGFNGNGGYETAGFAAGGPNGFDSTQAFSQFSPGTEGYQTGGYPEASGYGPQDTGQQVPVYQPGPLPDEAAEFNYAAYDRFGYPSAGQQQYAPYSDPYSDPYSGLGGSAAAPAGPMYDGYGGYGGYDNNYSGYDTYGGGLGNQQGYVPQQSPYGNSDTFGGGGGLGAGSSGADAYGSMYGNGDTYGDGQTYFPQPPTGGAGAWVPQQREPDQQMPQMPQTPEEQQQYPYQNGDPYGYGTQGNGYGAGNGYYY